MPCVAGVRKRVHLAPNPAWLRVNEVTIGVTSTDTLKDLSGEEVSAEGTRGNRLARLAGHMLSQQSFYPLFPPPITSPAQLDMRHAQRWCMPTSPDVLLVPSKLAQFAREVQVWSITWRPRPDSLKGIADISWRLHVQRDESVVLVAMTYLSSTSVS